MSYNNYMLMYYIALAVCILLLIVAVILFFVLNIPKAFGDITGRTAKKAIRNIKEQEERNKIQRETERVSRSGRIIEDTAGNTVITEKIATDNLTYSSETIVLENAAGETTVLEENMIPGKDSMETAPLDESDVAETKQGYCREIQSIILIHTAEIIG